MAEKLPEAIAHRLKIAREDVESYRAKAAFIGNQGGPHPLFSRVAFHEGRVQLLEWMLAASLADIQSAIATLERELGDAVSLKYGSIVGLPDDLARRIAHLELLEYGIGEHALQKGGA